MSSVGRWYTLAGNVNLFLAYSAVGVIISFVFITDKDSRDENRDYRKLKNKEKTVFWKHSNCRSLSTNNKKKSAMGTANTLTLVAY